MLYNWLGIRYLKENFFTAARVLYKLYAYGIRPFMTEDEISNSGRNIWICLSCMKLFLEIFYFFLRLFFIELIVLPH